MAFWTPLSTLVQFCFREEQYSHLILIPGVSAFLLFRGRSRIFAHIEAGRRVGIGLLAAGALFAWFGHTPSPCLS